jgi:transposase
MAEQELREQRKLAVHLRRSGLSSKEVAEKTGRSRSWVNKWYNRYKKEGWMGLKSRSRMPQKSPNKLKKEIKRLICQVRSELEAEAAEKDELSYVGSKAIRSRLKQKKVEKMPSTASIERVLRAKKMTRPKKEKETEKVKYPHLKPKQAGELCQIDIVPHYLKGGQSVACFNAIDVVSRYPTGWVSEHRCSQDAANFLLKVWQQIGVPKYTQVDNEGCFSGGSTHPGVLGKVLRLALFVKTELVFSPFYHPESNCFVERFHQDYNTHVWRKTTHENLDTIQTQAECFFAKYRLSEHHSALNELTPFQVHHQHPVATLASDFKLPDKKLPLFQGKVHFIRLLNADNTISLLNLSFALPKSIEPLQGLWATLHLHPSFSSLRVYDFAPDVPSRSCLAQFPFPLKESVQPYSNNSTPSSQSNLFVSLITRQGFIVPKIRSFVNAFF